MTDKQIEDAYVVAHARYEAYKQRTRDRQTYTAEDAAEDAREYELFAKAQEAFRATYR